MHVVCHLIKLPTHARGNGKKKTAKTVEQKNVRNRKIRLSSILLEVFFCKQGNFLRVTGISRHLPSRTRSCPFAVPAKLPLLPIFANCCRITAVGRSDSRNISRYIDRLQLKGKRKEKNIHLELCQILVAFMARSLISVLVCTF